MVSYRMLASFVMVLVFGACGGGGGGGCSSSPSAAANVVRVPIVISSGGVTVGANDFKFDLTNPGRPGLQQNMFARLSEFLLSSAYASTTYKVSPDKAKLRLTHFTIGLVETASADASVAAFNQSQICEIDYDKANPNQTFTCTVELIVGLHYK